MQWGELTYGTVFFCENFEFPDGGDSDKLFICIGHREFEAVIAVTTSRPPKFDMPEACEPRRGMFLLKKSGANKLHKDTYVQLYRPGIVTTLMMREKRFQDAVVKFRLPDQDINAIKNCAGYCLDMPPVIKARLGPLPPAKKQP